MTCHILTHTLYIQYDKYEDQKGTRDSDMDTQALLVWPTLHSIAEPFKLQADTLGVHLRWADDIYTEFFPEYSREDGGKLLSNPTGPTVNLNSPSHRDRIYSADDESFLAMNHSHKPGHLEGLDDLDEFAVAATAAVAAAAGRKHNLGGVEVPTMARGSSVHGLLGNAC